MSVEIGQGVELVMVEDGSDKFRRGLHAGNVVATHYGRRGSLGQVTVHHLRSGSDAAEKWAGLYLSKERKGYRRTTQILNFDVPAALLDSAASTSPRTGNGGKTGNLGHALIAYWMEQAIARGAMLDARDPIADLLTSGTLDARTIALASLAGYSPTDPAVPGMDIDGLAVMACLVPSDITLPTPADLDM